MLDELIGAIQQQHNDSYVGATAEELKDAWGRLSTEHQFNPGELVTWKPGLKNKKWPKENEPALVISTDVNEFDPQQQRENGLPTAKPDLVCLVKAPNGDLDAFPFESFRLQPYDA